MCGWLAAAGEVDSISSIAACANIAALTLVQESAYPAAEEAVEKAAQWLSWAPPEKSANSVSPVPGVYRSLGSREMATIAAARLLAPEDIVRDPADEPTVDPPVTVLFVGVVEFTFENAAALTP